LPVIFVKQLSIYPNVDLKILMKMECEVVPRIGEQVDLMFDFRGLVKNVRHSSYSDYGDDIPNLSILDLSKMSIAVELEDKTSDELCFSNDLAGLASEKLVGVHIAAFKKDRDNRKRPISDGHTIIGAKKVSDDVNEYFLKLEEFDEIFSEF
jgi:hypothetical protein